MSWRGGGEALWFLSPAESRGEGGGDTTVFLFPVSYFFLPSSSLRYATNPLNVDIHTSPISPRGAMIKEETNEGGRGSHSYSSSPTFFNGSRLVTSIASPNTSIPSIRVSSSSPWFESTKICEKKKKKKKSARARGDLPNQRDGETKTQ